MSLKIVASTSKLQNGDILISKIKDAVRLSSLRRNCYYLGFLNEAEQNSAIEYFNSINFETFDFYGGYESATRKILIVSYGDTIDYSSVPIKTVGFFYRNVDKLSHRDFLGAIMSLGIERNSIGDIIVNEGKSVVFIKNEISDYVVSQITKVGSVGVKLRAADIYDFDLEQKFENLNIIVSSLRLDVVVSKLSGFSREKTSKLILSGDVSLNHVVCTNSSKKLYIGDIISVRKKGKFVFKAILGETKKARLRLLIQLFR